MLTSRNALGTCFTDRAFNFRVIGERSVSHYTESGNISLLYDAFPQRLIPNYQICWYWFNNFGEQRFIPAAAAFTTGQGDAMHIPLLKPAWTRQVHYCWNLFPSELCGRLGCCCRRAGAERQHFKTLHAAAFESVFWSYQNTLFFQISQWNKHMLHF